MPTADTTCPERVRQLAGLPVQLAIRQALVAGLQCPAFRVRCSLVQKAGMKQRTGRQRRRLRLQCHQRIGLGRIQKVDLPHRLARIGHRGAQHAFVHAQPAPDRLVVEQVGVVLGLDTHAVGDRRHIEEQLEILVVARDAAHLDVQPGEMLPVGRHIRIDVEQHAHQRQPARVALQRELLQQRAVGQRLVLEGIEQQVARIAHQRLERCLCIDRHTQRQQVDAMADQRGHVTGELAGGRDADHQVVLRSQPVQRGSESTQHGCEQAGPGA